jgi:hypothetical protein
MKSLFSVIMILFSFFISSTAFSQEKINAFLRTDIKVDKENNIYITGETNLPDNTELVVSAEQEKIGNQYLEESTVSSSKLKPIKITPFGDFQYGVYLIEISLLNPDIQPVAVQELIGQKGKFLIGKLVTISDSGCNDIKYTTKVNVGTPQQIKESIQRYKKTKLDIWNNMKLLVKAGRKMEVYRGSLSPDCINNLRKNHEKVKALQDKIFKLPLTTQTNQWRYGVGLLMNCTDCTSEALDWCNNVDGILDSNKP